MLFELSPEQEKLIPVYREKWQNIALSTEAIAPQQAREAVERAYIAVGKAIPEIVFVDSPLAASQIILDRLKKYQIKWLLMNSLNDRLDLKLSKPLIQNIKQKVLIPIWGVDHWLTKLKTEHQYIVEIQNKIRDRLDDNFSEVMLPKDWTSLYSLYDFCISILGYDCNSFVWNSFESIMKYCGYIYGFETVCIICDRPKQYNVDRDIKPHGEGKPAIEFTDGFSLYFHHGIPLPEKYGKQHPDRWSIELFLEIQDYEVEEIFVEKLGLKIHELTEEQKELILVYKEKWSNIFNAIQSNNIDRNLIKNEIELFYEMNDLIKPKIVFCDSPKEIDNILLQSNTLKKTKIFDSLFLDEDSLYGVYSKSYNVYHKIIIQLNSSIRGNLQSKLSVFGSPRFTEFILFLEDLLYDEVDDDLVKSLIFRDPIQNLNLHAVIDYCINVLGCACDRKMWQTLQNIELNSLAIFAFEEICLVYDRLPILSFDAEDRLHAEGKPAIEFADGFNVYAYHGVRFPEKYGKYPPSQWRSQWILSEENAEIRRALIQGIGYARICQDLQAVELDTWREYSLLKIDVEFAEELHEEPIYLLKMTCPSTRHIHVLRVPPTMNSAREAIAWVNWDIDPEEFSVQT